MIQQAYGDQILSRAQVFQWHARFNTGRTSVDDDEHTRRTTSCTTPETVARIQELVRHDRRRTIHYTAEVLGIGYGTCQRVLTKELGMQSVAAEFLPRILTADQKQQRADDETFLSRVIAGDESWVTTLKKRNNPSSGKTPLHQGQTDVKQCQEHDHHFL
jgi:hypothetical protein